MISVPEDAAVQFDESLDRWILAALTFGRNETFPALLAALPGVYPTAVLTSLQRLANSGKVHPDLALLLTADAGKNQQIRPQGEPVLPPPHPLDYDWRFTSAATRFLLDRCVSLTMPADAVAFLGTPSLAIQAARENLARRFVLLDQNQAAIQAVQCRSQAECAIACDLCSGPIPSIPQIHAIVADPPWYVPHLQSFLWAAARLCNAGAHVLLSVPAIGTRPGVDSEWTCLVAWAEQAGLCFKGIDRGVLTYAAPLFERNALRAAGINNIPHDWRRADLAVFVRSDSGLCARPEPLRVTERWREQIVSGVSIRFRESLSTEPPIFKDPSLRRIIEGDILPTVSSRDPRRLAADIWTTGNRIFSCYATQLFGITLLALADGRCAIEAVSTWLQRPLHAHEATAILRVARQTQKLVRMEAYEQSHNTDVGPALLAVRSA